MSRDDTVEFRQLLRRFSLGLVFCAALVTVCYFYIDRPTAFFVHEYQLSRVPLLLSFTYTPMLLNALSPLLVLYSAVRRAWGPLSRLEHTLLGASVALMVAIAIEWYLKACFGRYWPATWVNGNPSLLGSGDYGFHPFHFGDWYGSFPSGHTARTFAPLAVVWSSYPRLLWPSLGVCLTVVLGLVGMNYHFVGDTVGGAYLGIVTGAYTAAFFGVGTEYKKGQ